MMRMLQLAMQSAWNRRLTLGRALMHAECYEEAEVALHAAVELHRQRVPKEEPRSLVYLATCLRMRGAVDEALGMTARARAASDGRRGWRGVGRCGLPVLSPVTAR